MKAPLVKMVYALAVLAAAGYAFFALRGPDGIPGVIRRHGEIRQMEQINAKLAVENGRMRDHIGRMKDNSSEQELEVRKTLKMVKPGETVYITGQPAGAPPKK